MAMQAKRSECYLCGNPATQRDHVPPRNLFPEPRPGNLITVPVCANCHGTTSEDDELFRLGVIAQQDPNDPRVATVWDATLRGLQRPESRPSRMIRELLPQVDRVTEAGIIVGQAPGVALDRPRMQREIDRITRGMYWHRFGMRLPDGYYVADFEMDPVVSRIGEVATDALRNSPLFQTDDRVYEYRMVATQEDSGATIFLSRFFEKTVFITWTLPDGFDDDLGASNEE